MGGVGRFLSPHRMENLSANLAKRVSPEHKAKNIKTNAPESFKLRDHKLMSQSFASDIEYKSSNGIKIQLAQYQTNAGQTYSGGED